MGKVLRVVKRPRTSELPDICWAEFQLAPSPQKSPSGDWFLCGFLLEEWLRSEDVEFWMSHERKVKQFCHDSCLYWFDWHGIKLASQSELRSDRHAEPYWEVRCSWLLYNFSSSRVALKYGKHDAFFRLVSLSSMRHTSSPKQKRGMQKACLVSKCHVKYKPRLEEPWIRVVVFPTFTHGRHFFGGHDPSRTLRFLSHTWADWQLQVQRPNCPPVGYWILVIDRSQEIEVKHCFFYQQIVGFKFVWIWKIWLVNEL